MSKNKKEHRMSERKKYLKTLMADMGLADIRSLPKEEAERWQRAAEPQKVVQRKLKEMGYSLNSDNNKRSLGRTSRLLQIKRAAELNPDIKKLQDILGLDAYREVAPTILPIFSMMGSFSKKKYIEESLTAIENINPDAASDPEVKKALERLSSSLFKTLSFNKDIDKIIYDNPDASLKIDDLSDNNKKTIIALLAGEEFLDPSSPSDDDIIRALKDFQKANGLTPNGEIDSRTYSKMILGSDGSINAPEKSFDNEKSKASEKDKPVAKNPEATNEYNKEFDHNNIRNIQIGQRADLDSSTEEVQKLVSILDKIAGDMGISFTITSAYRSDYNQARIMYNNYSSRGVGSYRARSYLESLYRRLPNISQIVDVFETNKSRDDKIKEAEAIISRSWGVFGHRAGRAIDIAGASKSDFDELLARAEEYVYFSKKLWEGDHYHIVVDSIVQDSMLLS